MRNTAVVMTIRAKNTENGNCPASWFRIHRGRPFRGVFKLIGSPDEEPVDLSNRRARFRVYSQLIDRQVLIEVDDLSRSQFLPDGTWRLALTADETSALPRGGMKFTVEQCVETRRQDEQPDAHSHLFGASVDERNQPVHYRVIIEGGVSCRELRRPKNKTPTTPVPREPSDLAWKPEA
jgi:hypothetical protein